MITLKMISEKISAWLRNRCAAREWSPFSDPELRPLFASAAPIPKTSFGAEDAGGQYGKTVAHRRHLFCAFGSHGGR